MAERATNKDQTFPPEIYTQEEMRQILSATRRDPYGRSVEQAAIGLMYGAGLRVAEVLDLEPHDIDLAEGSIKVRRGKGKKHRICGMSKQAAELVAKLLQARQRAFIAAPKLFVRKSGLPYTPGNLRNICKRIGRRVQIGKRIHCHGFRHTFASELRAEGVDIGVISKQLGHSSIATTARYLDHIAPVQVINAIRNR